VNVDAALIAGSRMKVRAGYGWQLKDPTAVEVLGGSAVLQL